MKKDAIEFVPFSELNVDEDFFRSLIDDYQGFRNWFVKKAEQREKVYVLRTPELSGFLYLKDEEEGDNNISPPLCKKRRLKIGTFKIDAHGTVLGERFIGIALNKMIKEGFDETYVTLFDKQERLNALFEKFGFKYWGIKNNGELVYHKTLDIVHNPYKVFPRIETKGKNKYLLSIYPKYHTKLFPDSKLHTEISHIVEDLSFTNTIEKVYLTAMTGVNDVNVGDLIVIYRTADLGKSAEYSSVATSVCTMIEKKHISEFTSLVSFIDYCGKGTVFTKDELTGFWHTKSYPYIIKMLYNFAFPKRIIRKELIEKVGIDRQQHIMVNPLSDKEFKKIIELGEVNEGYIIN
ncbi:MAG: hypothetical protein AB7V16_10265 [Vulcanibacillus sp.]